MNFIGKIYEISLGRKSIRTEGFQTPEVVRIRETSVYSVGSRMSDILMH
jgi:hypothetical protein